MARKASIKQEYAEMTQAAQVLLGLAIMGGLDFYCGMQLVRQKRYFAAAFGLVPGALVVILCFLGAMALG